jgi:hypothetical protein
MALSMGFAAAVNGVARDPWNLGPGELAPATSAQRPSWQVTRWPVSRDAYNQMVQAARAAVMVPGAPMPLAPSVALNPPVVSHALDGIGHTTFEPPDPAIAVGPTDVMTAVNDSFAVTAKGAMAPLAPLSLSALFGGVLPANASMFDPRLVYDHFAQRWIVVVAARREAPAGSWIMIATSQTANPQGVYNTWALDGALDGATATGNWADYPTLGFDEHAIYVAVNMFQIGGPFQYAKIRIINKNEAYAPGAPPLKWYDLWGMLNPDGSSAFTLQPAVHFRAAPGPAYLANALWPSGNTISLWTLTNPLASWNNPAGSPSLAAVAVACNPYDLPPAADQPGGPGGIATDDARLLNAEYREDGVSQGFWTCHTSKYSWPGEAQARSLAQWYQVNVATGAIVQQGHYGAAGKYYFFPTIQTASNGDAFIAFAESSAADYVQLQVTGRGSGDPVGSLRGGTIVQPGVSAYAGSRWGDYFSICRDPADPTLVWIAGGYAGATGSWATQLCAVHL